MIIIGDALTELKGLEEKSINCCVTSPPYFGLRDYGHPGQIGLEETPEEFVNNLLEVFREVHKVLIDDGTLWLNLGDSYATGGRGGGGSYMDERREKGWKAQSSLNGWRSAPPGLKHKDLIGIPWRVALALQSDGCQDLKAVNMLQSIIGELLSEYDGKLPDKIINVFERLEKEWIEAKGESWYLRQDIIWAKPNPMPESVKDRCTKSHEYIFLFSKSPKYYFDHEAIKEPAVYTKGPNSPESIKSPHGQGFTRANSFKRKTATEGKPGLPNQHREDREDIEYSGTRNKRSVWTVSTKPYKEAHFATFPPDLIKPCILAGCPQGGIVLDPFVGSGTVPQVAKETDRDFIGIDIDPKNKPLIDKRLEAAHYQYGF